MFLVVRYALAWSDVESRGLARLSHDKLKRIGHFWLLLSYL
jgi:hypothetical protein